MPIVHKFSIRPLGNVGFTDQLFQFNSLIKLGHAVGLEYVHLPFENARSSADIYEYLGFNDYLANRFPGPSGGSADPSIDIEIDDSVLESRGIRGFSALVEYVKDEIERLSAGAVRPALFRLALATVGARGFFGWIQNAVRDLPYGIDLRLGFERFGKSVGSSARASSLRVLVHIRLGDTAEICTPWGTRIFYEHGGGRGFVQVAEVGQAPRSVRPCDFHETLAQILAAVVPGGISMRVCSDGHARLIGDALKSSGRLGLGAAEIGELERLGASYDDGAFARLRSLEAIEFAIGESDENLRALIDGVLHADLVVVGNVQQMVPKLLLNYPSGAAVPLIVVHHPTARSPKFQFLGMERFERARVFPICVGSSPACAGVGEALELAAANRERRIDGAG